MLVHTSNVIILVCDTQSIRSPKQVNQLAKLHQLWHCDHLGQVVRSILWYFDSIPTMVRHGKLYYKPIGLCLKGGLITHNGCKGVHHAIFFSRVILYIFPHIFLFMVV